MAQVARYYDAMHDFTHRNAAFRTHSGFDRDAIHRFLEDPADGRFSPETVHRLIAPFLPEVEDFTGLDAGCGYGGTLFRLLPLTGGTWHGVTVSGRQVEVGRRMAEERGLAGRATISLGSYDADLGGPYHAIVAIESLAHSQDTAATVVNLARHLRPGGVLVVVDDVPNRGAAPAHAAWMEEFKRLWHCPVLPDHPAWASILATAGLLCEHDADLTPLTRPRDLALLEAAWADHAATLALRRSEGFGAVAEGELGGIRLEQLTRHGAISYRMMVARRA